MEANISFVKKIGNFFSNILLGETKEIIVRMDERLKHVSKQVENIEQKVETRLEPDVHNLRERFAALEERVSVSLKQ
jgi:polyhydroxyalkanoate synthesis regulator phasin